MIILLSRQKVVAGRICRISQSCMLLKKMIGRTKQKLLTSQREGPQQSKWEGDYDFEFYRFRVFKHVPLQRLHEIARILERNGSRLCPRKAGQTVYCLIFQSFLYPVIAHLCQCNHLHRNLRPETINKSAGHNVAWRLQD